MDPTPDIHALPDPDQPEGLDPGEDRPADDGPDGCPCDTTTEGS